MTTVGANGVLRVVSHEATRTGAPRVLLDLLRLVVDDLAVPLSVECQVGGPLESDFDALGVAPSGEPTALLVNSSVAAGEVLGANGVPAALYVHEDGAGLQVLHADARDAIASHYGLVLCVSDRSRRELEDIGVVPEAIRLVPPLIRPIDPPSADAVSAARTSLGVESGQQVVIGCGEGSWRKGADLFLQLVQELRDDESIVFAWLGHRPLPFSRMLDHDLASMGLESRMRWLDEVSSPWAHLAAADLVVMTSRSDPQPLVPIEAALLGTPTVGFAVGGMNDLAADGGARLVEYPDLRALAALVRETLHSPEAGAELVDSARRRWTERQSPEAVRPVFLRALAELDPGLVRRSR